MPTPSRRAVRFVQSFLRVAEFARVSKWVAFGIVVGICGGLVGIGFQATVAFASRHLLHGLTGIAGEGVGGIGSRWWLVLLVPALGGLVTGWLVSTFAPEAEGHGTDSLIHAFHRMGGVVRARVILLKALASAVTIGTGGSAGQEGPICQIGGGVGSGIARLLKLSEHDRRLLLLCGASAGLGAIFCAPLGAALFLAEVLYDKEELEGEAIVPCIISSIFAYVVFTTITGKHHSIDLAPATVAGLSLHGYQELPAYLVLAALCAVVGWFYVRLFFGVQRYTKGLSMPPVLRPALGGLLLGATALAIAPLAGSTGVLFGGYGLIFECVRGHLALQALAILAAAKVLATCLTISTGGSGGVFAPSLAIGATLGAAVGELGNLVFPDLHLNVACFALVGMGGFFAGVAKTPLAAVVMVSEMTAGYGLLAPLLLVSVVHLLLSGRRSLYSQQVHGMVESPAHFGEFVVDVLSGMIVEDLAPMLRKAHLVHERTTLREILHIVAEADVSSFPVVDDAGRPIGIFSLTDVRRIYLAGGIEDVIIARDLMVEKVGTARMTDTLDEVQRKMTNFHIHVIPVVEEIEGSGGLRVLGLLDRSDLGRAYERRLLALRGSDGPTEQVGAAGERAR